MLEKKIREQAQRLIELQTYKTLCENKIKQAFPDQPLPLNENHIRKPSYEVIKTDSNSDTLKNQIKELKAIILSKDEVLV